MADDVPARLELQQLLQPLCPSTWQWVTDEAARDDVPKPRVWLSQRTIGVHPTAPKRTHLIGFTVTVTAPQTDLAKAEAELDDDMDAFLWALDINRIGWETATKGIYDGRLGYQLGVNMQSQRKEP